MNSEIKTTGKNFINFLIKKRKIKCSGDFNPCDFNLTALFCETAAWERQGTASLAQFVLATVLVNYNCC